MIKTILIITFSIFILSCNKDNPPNVNTETQKNQSQTENASDTDSAMSAEESFSSALVEDIMGETDDIDLQVYLEEQIYPLVSKSGKVTIDRISSSQYLLSYNEGGAMKNMIIQKFYNPQKDEFVFEKSETDGNSLKQFVK